MRGEAVAQPMRADLNRYPRLFEMLFHDPRHAPGRDSCAAIVEEHRGFAFAAKIPFLSNFKGILAQRIERLLANRHNALLGPLAEHADDAELEIDIGPVKTHQLAHTPAG